MVPGVADAHPEGDEHGARDAPPLGLHPVHRLQELLNPAGRRARPDKYLVRRPSPRCYKLPRRAGAQEGGLWPEQVPARPGMRGSANQLGQGRPAGATLACLGCMKAQIMP